jgi:hypothetical protein
MPHQVAYYDKVLTIRLDGRCVAQQVHQDMRNNLDNQSAPVTAILDLTLATAFDQQLKSTFYRAFQHHHIAAVGICGVSDPMSKDIDDLVSVLRRVRKVAVCATEADVRAELGLATGEVQQKKLSGMLAYLKKGEA